MQGAIVKPSREGSTVPILNRTVTPMGITTIRMAGHGVCIDNSPDTSLMAMSRTFPCHHREMASEGSAQLPHWVPLHR
jgi:hypothetical protein